MRTFSREAGTAQQSNPTLLESDLPGEVVPLNGGESASECQW